MLTTSCKSADYLNCIPYTNFGDVMSRMIGAIYFDNILFSNLRRIKSWSVGLQYLEDVCREVIKK
jgi:hypothetical protein